KGLKPRGKVQKTVPHPALAWEAAPGFYAELEKREAVAAKALGFLMLTALRASEVRLARWDEFDLDKAVWTVPADRMKMGEEHRVPLSPTALELLWALPREKGNPYVFIGEKKGKPLSDAAMERVIARMHEAELKAGRTGYIDP